MTKNQKLAASIVIGIFLGALICSLICFSTKKIQHRYMYYFYSYDTDKICTEARRAQNKPSSTQIEYYVKDLLLGPSVNRYKNLFPRGTTIEFCYVDNKELYLGLSKEAVAYSEETYNLEENIKLFKYNIKKNFHNINKIHVFIDSNAVFEE